MSKDGYAILLEPISKINVKFQFPHIIIRSLEYIVDVIDQIDLELVSWLSTTFFLNYPYDSSMLKKKGKIPDKIF